MKREEICRLLADKVNKLKNKKIVCQNCSRCAFVVWRDAFRTYTGDVQAWHHNSLFRHKIGYINERVFRYDANEYLLLTVPLPFECETYATSEVPLAGLRLKCRYFAVTGTVDGHWRR